MKKIGYCCKFKAPYNLSSKEASTLESSYNSKSTTVTAIKSLTKKELFTKLEPILEHNLTSTLKLIEYTATLPKELHMLRLSSDLLPLYTHEAAKNFWLDPAIQRLLEEEFKKIGTEIKKHHIRTGFHPGQFCVLNSQNERVLKNSIKEFEYHIDMARWMNFTKWHEAGFYCNVHVGGKEAGVEGLIKNLKKLSKEARNLITIENDEYSFGVDEFLKLEKHVALVLDVHHHWCKTGEYIQNTDERVQRIIASWCGVRPLLHYSLSQEDLFPQVDKNILLDLKTLKGKGLKVGALRAHSNTYWNQAANEWISSFWKDFDLELECKDKNQAALSFLKEIKNL